MGECARAKSFFDSQIKHLRSLPFDDAMKRIAGAVPVCMLHLIWTCDLDQHYIRCSLSGEHECNAMTLYLKLVLFLVLVCGAHRNGVASYHDATRAWRRCAVFGASCPCAPTKGPSG